MKISNWLKSGTMGKRMFDVFPNIHCNLKGVSWDAYVQIEFYAKETQKFIRLNMSVDDAKEFQEKLNNDMKIFED